MTLLDTLKFTTTWTPKIELVYLPGAEMVMCRSGDGRSGNGYAVYRIDWNTKGPNPLVKPVVTSGTWKTIRGDQRLLGFSDQTDLKWGYKGPRQDSWVLDVDPEGDRLYRIWDLDVQEGKDPLLDPAAYEAYRLPLSGHNFDGVWMQAVSLDSKLLAINGVTGYGKKHTHRGRVLSYVPTKKTYAVLDQYWSDGSDNDPAAGAVGFGGWSLAGSGTFASMHDNLVFLGQNVHGQHQMLQWAVRDGKGVLYPDGLHYKVWDAEWLMGAQVPSKATEIVVDSGVIGVKELGPNIDAIDHVLWLGGRNLAFYSSQSGAVRIYSYSNELGNPGGIGVPHGSGPGGGNAS